MLHSMTKDADLRYPRIVLYGDKKIHRKMKEVLARRGKSVSDWYREKQREFLEENKAEVERLLKSRSESQEEKTTDDPKV